MLKNYWQHVNVRLLQYEVQVVNKNITYNKAVKKGKHFWALVDEAPEKDTELFSPSCRFLINRWSVKMFILSTLDLCAKEEKTTKENLKGSMSAQRKSLSIKHHKKHIMWYFMKKRQEKYEKFISWPHLNLSRKQEWFIRIMYSYFVN